MLLPPSDLYYTTFAITPIPYGFHAVAGEIQVSCSPVEISRSLTSFVHLYLTFVKFHSFSNLGEYVSLINESSTSSPPYFFFKAVDLNNRIKLSKQNYLIRTKENWNFARKFLTLFKL